MNRRRTLRDDDRGVSSTVTHVLALGITAILISGLLLSAATVVEDQRENSAREQLRTVGNRISAELSRAAVLAQHGGNVSIRTSHPHQIAGEEYTVRLLTGADCDTDLFHTDACLSLATQGGGTSVMVPVRNETGVSLARTGAGSFTIAALANESAPEEPTPMVARDLRVGVGADIGEFSGGSIVNLTNRAPIAGFTVSPGQPTVESIVHFENDTKDLDGIIADYTWTLGDGTTIEGVDEFNHSYAEPGRYTVTLTVTDDDGETDNVSKVISVGGLVYNGDGSVTTWDRVGTGGPKESLDFFVGNRHDAEIEIRDVLVDPANDTIDRLDAGGATNEVFIDGDAAKGGYDDAEDLFPGGRIYDLDDDGFGAAVVPKESDPNSDPRVELNGFRADGADAPMGGEPIDVAMRYRVGGEFYTAQFTVNGGGGGGNAPPDPTFTVSCPSPPTCDFDGSGSSDDSGITDYEWSFDDGDTTAGPALTTPTHAFPANGSYDVSLTVTDDDGVTSTFTRTVNVGGDAPVLVWAVNAGGDATTANGVTYEADHEEGGGFCFGPCPEPHQYFDGPEDDEGEYTWGDTAGTTDDELYEHYRLGDFRYDVPVANGEYEVTFKFAEYTEADRQFDVKLEGTEVITDLNVYDEVGASTAYEATRTVTVSDGSLDIGFETDNEQAMLGALVVTRTDAFAYQEADNVSQRVVMEAENRMRVVPGSGDLAADEWVEVADSDASDGTALEAQPDNGDNAQDTEAGERLDYYVDFDAVGVDYNVWVRMACPGGDADSIHVGLDGTPQSYGDVGLTANATDPCRDASGWVWASHADGSQVTVTPTTTGLHTFNVWVREDGTRIDKIVLTTDDSFDPTGQTIDETPIG